MTTSEWTVAPVTGVVDDQVIHAVIRLSAQLSPEKTAPTPANIRAAVNSSTKLLLARNQQHQIGGCVAVCFYHVPFGLKCRVESVCVDSVYRGTGLGKLMMSHVLTIAKQAGAEAVELNSKPHRLEANRMYQRLGFQLRQTNVYTLALKSAL